MAHMELLKEDESGVGAFSMRIPSLLAYLDGP